MNNNCDDGVQKNIAACIQFAQGLVDKPEGCWKNVCIVSQDETNVELFSVNEKPNVWCSPNMHSTVRTLSPL